MSEPNSIEIVVDVCPACGATGNTLNAEAELAKLRTERDALKLELESLKGRAICAYCGHETLRGSGTQEQFHEALETHVIDCGKRPEVAMANKLALNEERTDRILILCRKMRDAANQFKGCQCCDPIMDSWISRILKTAEQANEVLGADRDALKLELEAAYESLGAHDSRMRDAEDASREAIKQRDLLLILCGKMRAELVKLNSGWTVGPYRELLQQANEVLGEVKT